jgi:hypothetical protein
VSPELVEALVDVFGHFRDLTRDEKRSLLPTPPGRGNSFITQTRADEANDMKKPFLTILVIAVAAFGIGFPQTASAQIGAGSCVGIDACLDGPTIAGDNSCIGDEACFEGPDEVGDNTCVGAQLKCDSTENSCPNGDYVFRDPNNGCNWCPCPLPGQTLPPCPVPPYPPSGRVCYQAGGPGPAVFGDDSCDGIIACQGKVGGVGSRACNGDAACSARSGAVGDDACDGHGACRTGSGAIASGSCNGDGACDSSGSIGAGSCNDGIACLRVASVGTGSCNGTAACQDSANVGNNSCNGDEACLFASAAIGDCEMNTVIVAACAQSIPTLQPFGLNLVAVLMLAVGLCARNGVGIPRSRHGCHRDSR